jgi:enolase
MPKISRLYAREILSSQAIPTIETACQLDNGLISVSSVPAGTSTGSHEALELRDNDLQRFLGKGVLKAVDTVNNFLNSNLHGLEVTQQIIVDQRMIELDGTENKSKLGANSILSVSEAVCKAAALSLRKPLYTWIMALAQQNNIKVDLHIPTPIFNMINGGSHGAGNLDFQEFQVIPASSKNYSQGIRIGVEIYLTIGNNLARRGAIHSVGLEGGYAPNLFTNSDALEIFVEAIKQANYLIGRDVFLGLDIASNFFHKDGRYQIKDVSSVMDDEQMIDFYKNLNTQYRLAILEDPLHEDSWEGWKKLHSALGGQVVMVGDDLLVTNPQRVAKAIKEDVCDGILIKPNQIGTVSEALNVIKMARDAKWKVVVSHRSEETNDSFIADFAVGVGADYVKFGAPARGERVAKYNRLLAIESELSFSKK